MTYNAGLQRFGVNDDAYGGGGMDWTSYAIGFALGIAVGIAVGIAIGHYCGGRDE
jgi:uncharacterized membrane protein YdjX (TVP38/TMEM64 family)